MAEHMISETGSSDEDTEVLLRSQNSRRLPPQMSEKIVSSLKSMSAHKKQALNLVLCGRRETLKASAAKAFLNQRELCPGSTMPEFGWVSLVDLPASYGGPNEAVMEKSHRYRFLSDPEGVYVFMLVLPVGQLTDEDKKELKTIQKTFSSQVKALTTILFTVKPDQTATDVDNFLKGNEDIQELIQSCDGRYFILNSNDEQQIPEAVHKKRNSIMNMPTKAEMEKTVEQEQEEGNIDAKPKAKQLSVKQSGAMGGDDDGQSRERLRMVLIGKTGSGKSATANTILGYDHFTPRIAPKPANTSCEQATGELDGRPVTVVNTPGLYDTDLSDAEVQEELHKCFTMLAPGPHVFLLVLQIGFITPPEKDSVELIKRVFGKKAKDFILIIFTRGEALEGQSVESYIGGCDGFVKLVNDCGGRYAVLDHRAGNNQEQVRELLTKVETMVEANGGNYYTADMFQLAKGVYEREVEQIRKREMYASMRRNEEMEQMKKKLQELERDRQQNQGEEVERLRKELKEMKEMNAKFLEKKNKRVCNIA